MITSTANTLRTTHPISIQISPECLEYVQHIKVILNLDTTFNVSIEDCLFKTLAKTTFVQF